jgi:hypothetical protein
LPLHCCRYCGRSFQPSRFRHDQAVCSQTDCQGRRRADYHREKIRCDPVYRQVVRDSQKKWRDEHPSYSKDYRDSHPEVVERNRESQVRRDQRDRIQDLAKNNLAFDLKRSLAEVWLVGAEAKALAKNNLASGQLFIFQTDTSSRQPQPGS